MISIQNLTPLQRDICERLWNMESQEEVMAWFDTLPRSIQHVAYAMLQMIVAELLDQEPMEDLGLARQVLAQYRL